MRQDPLTGEWISIAAARQNRTFFPPAEQDPLAPSTPGNATEIPDYYDVVVFENRSPSFGPALPASGDETVGPEGLDTVGLGRSQPSFGRCEVVCFGPEHEGSLASFSVSRVRTVVEAWADRTAELSALPGVRQVFPFENRGEAIGVTLRHPHGQVYAYPFITPRTQRLLEAIRVYGPTLFADILDYEQQAERVLIQGEYFTAFVPFAARWPTEIHLLPHRHVPDLAATSMAERDELAVICRRLLRALDRLYDSPTPYIAAWHQAPVDRGRSDVRLMLQITSPQRAADKLKFLAGSESAMGAFIGDIEPEVSARRLRSALEQVDD
jgi:UDPglucose--hexose-1-phosphate uridylyltransferase